MKINKFSQTSLYIVFTIVLFLSFGFGWFLWKVTGFNNLSPVESNAMLCGDGNGGWVNCGWTCFPAGTEVEMKNGYAIDIENVKVGDKVISQSEDNERSISVVTEIERPVRNHMCEIDFAGGDSLKLTAEHPIFTNTGWKSINPEMTFQENSNLLVGQLRRGDKVVTFNGNYAEVYGFSCWTENIQTYNLILNDGAHTYFADDFLAHNKKDVPNENYKEYFIGYLDEEIANMGVDACKSLSAAASQGRCDDISIVNNPTNYGIIEDEEEWEDKCKENSTNGVCNQTYEDYRNGSLGTGENYNNDDPCEGEASTGCGACQNDNGCVVNPAVCSNYLAWVIDCQDCPPESSPNTPPVNPNICDGGGIVEQTISMEVGVPITVTGWAYDRTGIDTSAIVVRIDGVVVGNATSRAGCPTQISTCNSTYANVITWSYTFTPTKEEHVIGVTWQDIEGKTAANCSAATIFEMKNVCEGGGIVTQTSSIEIGDPVNIVGWAYDADGINQSNIAVNIDGVFAGNATTASGCPS